MIYNRDSTPPPPPPGDRIIKEQPAPKPSTSK